MDAKPLRFEMDYNPKHGSWLNSAKTELSSLQKLSCFAAVLIFTGY